MELPKLVTIPTTSAAAVQEDLLWASPSHFDSRYVITSPTPSLWTTETLHSVQTAAEARGSLSADVSESLDTHSMTKTDGL